jgi:hypothetical protein
VEYLSTIPLTDGIRAGLGRRGYPGGGREGEGNRPDINGFGGIHKYLRSIEGLRNGVAKQTGDSLLKSPMKETIFLHGTFASLIATPNGVGFSKMKPDVERPAFSNRDLAFDCVNSLVIPFHRQHNQPLSGDRGARAIAPGTVGCCAIIAIRKPNAKVEKIWERARLATSASPGLRNCTHGAEGFFA